MTEIPTSKRCLRGQHIEPQGSPAGASWRASAVIWPMAIVTIALAIAELVMVALRAWE